MRLAVAVALVLAGASPLAAQSRRAMLCTEEVSVALTDPVKPEDPKTETLANRSFSASTAGNLLTVISAGRSDYFECQRANPRLNEGRPRNTVKCQNGIYFVNIDLDQLKFVRAQLNPETKSQTMISYGSCKYM